VFEYGGSLPNQRMREIGHSVSAEGVAGACSDPNLFGIDVEVFGLCDTERRRRVSVYR
jgi:hypothetical protein